MRRKGRVNDILFFFDSWTKFRVVFGGGDLFLFLFSRARILRFCYMCLVFLLQPCRIFSRLVGPKGNYSFGFEGGKQHGHTLPCLAFFSFFPGGNLSICTYSILFFFFLFLCFFLFQRECSYEKIMCMEMVWGQQQDKWDTLGYRLWDLDGRGISGKRKKLEMGTDGRT